ncbi:MAG: hypothetical protein ABIP30_01970, partial [Ferruginibacter sp.]
LQERNTGVTWLGEDRLEPFLRKWFFIATNNLKEYKLLHTGIAFKSSVFQDEKVILNKKYK